jgi:hypothetical protein
MTTTEKMKHRERQRAHVLKLIREYKAVGAWLEVYKLYDWLDDLERGN